MINVRRKIVNTAVIVTVGIAGLVFANSQTITDNIIALQYNTSEEMQNIIDTVGMTDGSNVVFKASKPVLHKTQQFNELCGGFEDKDSVHVLGCYTGSNIHLFEVSDERLEGMTEVTAAHELLHAVYNRLNFFEKTKIKNLLVEEYESLIKKNPELEERMQAYSDLEESQFINELHSVLGTEVGTLSPELESYYNKIFKNRQEVFSLFNSYTTYMKELSVQINNITDKLGKLNDDIDEKTLAYQSSVDLFNKDVDVFIQRNQNREFSGNPEEFYRIKDELSLRESQLDDELANLNASVVEYNKLRDELILLDETATDIVKSMDSKFAAPKQVAE